MRSLHTKQSVPAKELLSRGKFKELDSDSGERLFAHERPGNQTSGVGPVGTYWAAEASDEACLRAHGLWTNYRPGLRVDARR
jgi:hypothetical protein